MHNPDFNQQSSDFLEINLGLEPLDGQPEISELASLLRAAYSAGLERAAEIADEAVIVAVEVHGNFPKGAACSELANAIRAEKETEND